MSAVPKGVWTNRLTSCSGTVRRDLLICDDRQALTGGFRAPGIAFDLRLRLDAPGSGVDNMPFKMTPLTWVLGAMVLSNALTAVAVLYIAFGTPKVFVSDG